jgi:uncharacterized protein
MRHIGGLLGRSPQGPIREHMLKVQECAARLPVLMDAYLKGDGAAVTGLVAEVTKLEDEADIIKREIREELSQSMFTAVQRGEVMHLLKAQDDVADDCLDVARWFDVRFIAMPAPLQKPLRDLCDNAVRVTGILADTTERLGASFGGAGGGGEDAGLHDSAEAVRQARHDVEREAHEVTKLVFAFESTLRAMGIFVLSQIVRGLGQAAESAENAADCIVRLGVHR